MNTTSPRLHAGIILAAALLAALLALLPQRPPAPLPADAPPHRFAAHRALPHVRALASAPRVPGTPHHAEAHRYVTQQLRDLGLSPTSQPIPGAPGAHLLLASLPGRDPTGRVLLLAHLDSTPGSPGAADDAAGVAALLEAARALRHTPPHHDVTLAFTDAEEQGLLGARLLAADLSQRPPDLAVNLEARGAAGPALLFESSTPDLHLLQTFAQAPRPVGNTLCLLLYERLPHATDLTPLLRSDVPGLNLAFIERPDRYHTPLDTPEHLDPASLQHLGDTALHLASTFRAPPDLPPHPTPHATFFSTPAGLLVYPSPLALPLAALAFALTLANAARDPRRRAHPAATLRALALHALLLPTTAALAYALAIACLPEHPQPLRHPVPLGDALTALVLALTAAAAALLRARLRRHIPPDDQRHAGLLLLASLAVAAALLRPEAAWVLTWPPLLAALPTLLLPARAPALLHLTLRAAAAAAIAALLAPPLLLAHTAALLRGAPATWLLVLITWLALAPLTASGPEQGRGIPQDAGDAPKQPQGILS